MKKLQIKLDRADMSDALNQIETLDVEPREKNIVRLLAEEMFSMMKSVLNEHEASFCIEKNDKEVELKMLVKADISEKTKEEYMSLSKSGKNIAHAGIIGKMKALIDGLIEAGPIMPGIADATDFGGANYSYIWTMRHYLETSAPEDKKDDWDGVEKSIIANFADDVLIGVRNNSLEMIVKKNF